MLDAYSLVVARLPQAFGLACLLVAHPAEPRRLPVVSVAAGIAAGSVIGNFAGWRAVFALTAALGLLATRCDWRTVPLLPLQVPRRAGEHPAVLACGLAGMIAAFNYYADFRVFGFPEAVVLAVGVVLFVIYARRRLRELSVCRSRLVTLWIFSVVAGACLLPAAFHIQDGYRLALVGAVLGLVWSVRLFRPVPVFSGLAVGIYAASYFLEFIPPSAVGAEFLEQQSRVLLAAAGVAVAGAAWSVAARRGQRQDKRD
jgi:predicted MFS family arabinose efflux permease